MPNITLLRDIYLTIPPLLDILKVSKFLLFLKNGWAFFKCLCRSKIISLDKFLGVGIFNIQKKPQTIIKAFAIFNGFLLWCIISSKMFFKSWPGTCDATGLCLSNRFFFQFHYEIRILFWGSRKSFQHSFWQKTILPCCL